MIVRKARIKCLDPRSLNPSEPHSGSLVLTLTAKGLYSGEIGQCQGGRLADGLNSIWSADFLGMKHV